MQKVKKNNKRKSKNKEDCYYKEFPTLLRDLLDEKKLCTQQELADYVGIARQSVSLYKNGTVTPDINIFMKIVEYFKNEKGLKYSYDYWLGLTKEPSVNIRVKTINEKYGLTEMSLKKLERLAFQKNIVYDKSKFKSQLDTINLLLSEADNPFDSIIALIHKYLTIKTPNNFKIGMYDDGFMELYKMPNSNNPITAEYLNKGCAVAIGGATHLIDADVIIKGILVELENKLNKLKESESNECKGTGKK